MIVHHTPQFQFHPFTKRNIAHDMDMVIYFVIAWRMLFPGFIQWCCVVRRPLWHRSVMSGKHIWQNCVRNLVEQAYSNAACRIYRISRPFIGRFNKILTKNEIKYPFIVVVTMELFFSRNFKKDRDFDKTQYVTCVPTLKVRSICGAKYDKIQNLTFIYNSVLKRYSRTLLWWIHDYVYEMRDYGRATRLSV